MCNLVRGFRERVPREGKRRRIIFHDGAAVFRKDEHLPRGQGAIGPSRGGITAQVTLFMQDTGRILQWKAVGMLYPCCLLMFLFTIAKGQATWQVY